MVGPDSGREAVLDCGWLLLLAADQNAAQDKYSCLKKILELLASCE